MSRPTPLLPVAAKSSVLSLQPQPQLQPQQRPIALPAKQPVRPPAAAPLHVNGTASSSHAKSHPTLVPPTPTTPATVSKKPSTLPATAPPPSRPVASAQQLSRVIQTAVASPAVAALARRTETKVPAAPVAAKATPMASAPATQTQPGAPLVATPAKKAIVPLKGVAMVTVSVPHSDPNSAITRRIEAKMTPEDLAIFRDLKRQWLTQVPPDPPYNPDPPLLKKNTDDCKLWEMKGTAPVVGSLTTMNMFKFKGTVWVVKEPFPMDIEPEQIDVPLILQYIQPCHRGYARDHRGAQYKAKSFIYDLKNRCYMLNKFAATIVDERYRSPELLKRNKTKNKYNMVALTYFNNQYENGHPMIDPEIFFKELKLRGKKKHTSFTVTPNVREKLGEFELNPIAALELRTLATGPTKKRKRVESHSGSASASATTTNGGSRASKKARSDGQPVGVPPRPKPKPKLQPPPPSLLTNRTLLQPPQQQQEVGNVSSAKGDDVGMAEAVVEMETVQTHATSNVVHEIPAADHMAMDNENGAAMVSVASQDESADRLSNMQLQLGTNAAKLQPIAEFCKFLFQERKSKVEDDQTLKRAETARRFEEICTQLGERRHAMKSILRTGSETISAFALHVPELIAQMLQTLSNVNSIDDLAAIYGWHAVLLMVLSNMIAHDTFSVPTVDIQHIAQIGRQICNFLNPESANSASAMIAMPTASAGTAAAVAVGDAPEALAEEEMAADQTGQPAVANGEGGESVPNVEEAPAVAEANPESEAAS